MQSTTGEAVLAITVISSTIERVNEIASTISTAVEEQGSATREIARNIQGAANRSSAISGNLGSVKAAASSTGAAADEVLGSARDIDSQADRLKSAVAGFLTQVRAA
jgi:methyl-accepting chemotaxis protein